MLTLVSYVGICISLIIIGLGFQLSKVHSPLVTEHAVGSSNITGCNAKPSCYDCTYEYDKFEGEDLVG